MQGASQGLKERVGVRVKVTGTQQHDYYAVFTGVRGNVVRVLVSAGVKRNNLILDTRRKLLFVDVIRRFSRMTHIRLPSGDHTHVPNSLIVE